MKALFLMVLFAFIGLIGSYAVFAQVNGSYVDPNVLWHFAFGPCSRWLYTQCMVLGVDHMIVKMMIGTGIVGFIGWVIGIATTKSSVSKVTAIFMPVFIAGLIFLLLFW